MIRARARRLGATVIIGSLLAIQAFAGSAGAAIPAAEASSQAIPPTYSAGHAAGFRGTFQLTDSSTLSKLFLRIDVNPAEGDNVYLLVTRKNLVTNTVTDVTSKCQVLSDGADDQDVTCEFKTVRNTEKFTAVAAYAPTGASISTTYIWNGTGVPDNGDLSHGDDWDAITHTATLAGSANVNYAGGFTINGDTTFANGGVGTGNAQSAKLVGLPIGLAATVRDGTDVTAVCTSDEFVDCTTAFGEWVETFVGDGQIVPEFQIQITYATGMPKGFVHVYGDPADPDQEFVGPCAKKNPTLPCFTWNNKTNTATIRTTHNGVWKGL